MRRWRSRRCIEVAPLARSAIEDAAESSLPAETGGILLGWRMTAGLHIAAAVEVPDPTATTHGYQRQFDAAEEVLRTLDGQPDDSPIGYIGEWHSHPAAVPASGADLRSIRQLARELGGPIGLIVASLHDDGWRLVGYLAHHLHVHSADTKEHS